MRLPIRIAEESREPIYHQIETQLKALIISGQLPCDSPLPSIRMLAKDLTCSVITTRKAYQNLEQQGFIKTIQGKGTFVRVLTQSEQMQSKQQIATAALQTAIEQAESLGCTRAEIQEIFMQILHWDNSKGASENA